MRRSWVSGASSILWQVSSQERGREVWDAEKPAARRQRQTVEVCSPASESPLLEILLAR